MAIIEIWSGDFSGIVRHKLKDFMLYVQKAKELDSALAYRALGLSAKLGVGSEQDYKKALKAFESACKMSDGGSCYNLALMYKNAQGVAQNFGWAKQLLARGCELGYNESCEVAREIEGRLDDESLESMHPEVRAATQECLNNLSYRESSDERALTGDAPNPNHKLTNAQRAQSCAMLGFHYWHGIEGYVPKNVSKALSAYTKGCDELEDGYNCYQVALLKMLGQGIPRDMKAALHYALKGCELGNPYSCQSVGNIYELAGQLDQGGAIEPDSTKALKYYKKACDEGVQVACGSYEALRQNVR
ncbi:Sel1 domain-containing protein repeat-containing protein [Helicobacter fennelliae]|uniref:Beta-lactamase n=1 Tax=Helicobacter fennelliae TaxID=215 RepID=A0A2X3BCN4_9HELI|nr:tetratricopeptide repeat protein [Helicobacter fennelliae]SQB99527.1 Sel1 domain-containing protein repeat-containing protein [Helicobacter fennelliae]